MSSFSLETMKLRYRPMQPRNIPACVNVLSEHPVIGPRYGPMVKHLAGAWRCLLGSEATFAVVFHVGQGESAPLCFFGFGVAADDEFVREMKRLPTFWVGPELTRRVIEGRSPVLTDKQVREANSCDGMNLLFWEGCAVPGFEEHCELSRCVMNAVIEVHRGYLWKEIIAAQSDSSDRLTHTRNTGGFLWDPVSGCYNAAITKDAGEIVSSPHIVGVTREMERGRQGNWSGSWIGGLFDYHTPILGFNRGEQRLLSCALSGATDEFLARTLGISLATIKKMWVSVYARVEGRSPALVSDLHPSALPSRGRGKEKRRGLLAYLREHPEELRPYSRKLLADAARLKQRSEEAAARV